MKYWQKKDLAPQNIHADMVATLGDDALQKMAAEFRKRNESLEDDPRSRHPATVITEENIEHFPTYW